MAESRLILSLPHGILTATSLTAEGFAKHRSPGSGKYFHGRTVLITLAQNGDKPGFRFLDEGGWRDANADAAAAIEATHAGKKTKTALSNNAFSCTPVSAYRDIYLVKTGGAALALGSAAPVATFKSHECHEGMTPAEIAKIIGQPEPAQRTPRLFMTLAPVEMLVFSNLTPAEYAWYATNRPGKVFRQVMFAEVRADARHLVAEAILHADKAELLNNASKKTKTLLLGDSFNHIQFPAWVGYDNEAQGGLYVADREGVSVWGFPATIPRAWEREY
jgi:hypothetical protein